MAFFPSPSQKVGIELEGDRLKIAAIQRRKQGWEVTLLKEGVKPVYTLPAEALIATALPTRHLLIRPFPIQLKKQKDILAALEFQVEPHLPFPLEKALLQHVRVREEGKGTLLTLLATKEEALGNHLLKHQEVGVVPDIVTCVPEALAALTEVLPSQEEPQLLLHIGEKEGTCALVEEGKLLAARHFDAAREGPERTLLALQSTYKEKNLSSLLLVSENSALAEVIQEETGLTVLLPKLTIEGLPEEKAAIFALPIGIALAAARKDQERIDFRLKRYVHPQPWRRIKKPLGTFFVLTATLIATLFVLGELSLSKREKRVNRAVERLLEQEAKGEISSTNENALALLEKEIEGRPKTFPLLPTVAKTSDLLAWIEATGEGITVEKFHYAMSKHPSLAKPNERYHVRVDLELSARSPSHAEAFYKALSEAASFVDQKHDIEWTHHRGKYKTSFFLKDKTRYG